MDGGTNSKRRRPDPDGGKGGSPQLLKDLRKVDARRLIAESGIEVVPELRKAKLARHTTFHPEHACGDQRWHPEIVRK